MRSLVDVLEGFYGTVSGGGIFCEPAITRRFVKAGFMNLDLFVFPTLISSNIPTNIVKEILNLKLLAKKKAGYRSRVPGSRELSYVNFYTFQQMRDVFAELIRRGKCVEEIKILREIYRYVQAHKSIANKKALGSMISLIFTLAALEQDRHIELPQDSTLEDIFRIANNGSQGDIDHIYSIWRNTDMSIPDYDGWFERLLPDEEQDS